MSQQDLKSLQAKWYKKLEKKGFKDIEDVFKVGQPLKVWDSMEFQKLSPEEFLEKQRFFELASQLLHTIEFKTPRDKRIWTGYCEGKSYKDIAAKQRVHYKTVVYVVKKYTAFIKT